ncbi:MAG: BspA family leucine-rich repeat surface protein, partial [Oscillospiraceae bacterium]|nr:BspA family leucine-rich repeat surface protein [Oscillospiraceae bacterium]
MRKRVCRSKRFVRGICVILAALMLLTAVPVGAVATEVITSGTVGVGGAPWRLYSDGTLVVDEGFIEWANWQSPWHNYREHIFKIVFTGPITAGTLLRSLFANLANVTIIEGLEDWDTSRVTDMINLFSYASSLENLDLSSWDTGSVTNMGGSMGIINRNGMFQNTRRLASLDVSGWDTSSVTNMSGMFASSGLTSLDLSGWDTSSVTNMGDIFLASDLTSLDLSGWDTSSVTNMSFMFSHSNLTSLDLSSWDTSNVTDMSFMFSYNSSLTSLDLSGWDTGSVISTRGMFRNASNLTTLELSGWDTGSVRDMSGMFFGASSLTSLNLSGWNTGNVTDMSFMFLNTSSLTSLDLSDWDTRNVTNMWSMFRGASSLTSLDVSGWDTRNVTSMWNMFGDVSNLLSLDLSSWNTGSTTDMGSMFSGAHSLISLDLSGWDTRGLTTGRMSGMFRGTYSLRQLTLGEYFSFRSQVANLPPVPQSKDYTGRWQNVGTGTIDDPQGTFIFTSVEMMAHFNGTTMADTWVWQPRTAAITKTELEAVIAEAKEINEIIGFTAESWTRFEVALEAALSVFDDPYVTRAEIDVVLAELRAAIDELTPDNPVPTDPNVIEFGRVGINGAPWRLYQDGTLVVERGLIEWTNSWQSPWHAYRHNIYRIIFSGPIIAGTSLQGLFAGLGDVSIIEGLEHFDTSNVVYMNNMFSGTMHLEKLGLSSWDTGNVTNMRGMFSSASSLSILNVSNFDTGNVTNMSSMFSFATSLTSLDLSGWNTARVTDMAGMFGGTQSLSRLVLGEDFRFAGNAGLPAVPGLREWRNVGTGTEDNPQGNFRFNSIQLMGSTNAAIVAGDIWVWHQIAADDEVVATGTIGPGGAPWRLYGNRTVIVDPGTIQRVSGGPWRNHERDVLRIVFTGPIVAQTSSLQGFFSGLREVASIEGLSYFDNSNVTNMSWMFSGLWALEELDLSGFDTRSVVHMDGMFMEAGLTSLDLSGFNTSSVGTMRYMFQHASSLTSLDLSGFDTRNVETMRAMFYDATGLTSLNLSSFDTRNVTDMHRMFAIFSHGSESNLESLDLSSFDTQNVRDMSDMFRDASALTSLDLSNFDTRNVTNMGAMFSGTSSLTNLDLSGWDTSNVRQMGMMFSGASSLTSLDLSGFDTRRVTNMWSMFHNTSLRQITLGEHFRFTRTRNDLGHGIIIYWDASLPPVLPDDTYTGYWQNGNFILTSAQLMGTFDGNTMAGTWFWQRRDGNRPTPPVNRTALQTAFATAEGRTESNYTPASWAELLDAKLDARNVLQNTESTQPQVDEALAALNLAKSNLVPIDTPPPVNRTALQTTLTTAEGHIEANYTPTSWVYLYVAKRDARGVLDDAGMEQKDIDNALAALVAAIEGLDPIDTPPPVDITDLQTALAEAEGRIEANYTPASWAELQAAKSDTRDVLQSTASTQAQVDEALAALDLVKSSLVPIDLPPPVNPTALQTALTEAEGHTEANYTPASWAELLAVKRTVRDVLQDEYF